MKVLEPEDGVDEVEAGAPVPVPVELPVLEPEDMEVIIEPEAVVPDVIIDSVSVAESVVMPVSVGMVTVPVSVGRAVAMSETSPAREDSIARMEDWTSVGK